MVTDTPPGERQDRRQSNEIDFNVKNIEAIKPPTDKDREDYKDKSQAGLYLRVTKNGVKTFSYVGRIRGHSQPERETIGRYPNIKPAQAIAKAKEFAGLHATGVSLKEPIKGKMTLSDLWDEYYAVIEKTTRRPEESKRIWEKHIKPKWGNKRLVEISSVAVERWHLDLPKEILKKRAEAEAQLKEARQAKRQAIEERRQVRKHGPAPKPEPPKEARKTFTGETAANRALEVMRAIFNFGMEDKRKYFVGDNPAKGHKSFQENERERFLFPSELKPFFLALAEEPNEDIRDAVLLALLTGQRRSNVLAMKWADINFDQCEWRLSGKEMKNGKSHRSVLTPEAMELLAQRNFDRIKAENLIRSQGKKVDPLTAQFVFPSDTSDTGHRVDIRASWDRIREKAGLTDVVLHDLRRTLGSWQARGGASLVLIGKTLNHQSLQATAIYARLDLDPVRQSVEAATSAMFGAAGLKKEAEVHRLPAKTLPSPSMPAKLKKVGK